MQKKPSLREIKTLAEILESFDMVLLVRNDLEMGEGKIAARRSDFLVPYASSIIYRKHNYWRPVQLKV
ncbi:hypothetical protein OPV22_025948 [Ensete ventricosum]|uniref:Uncharacterized protein n=1 Tax=Ensete ventricosum TaxID=4639 RepID=A0AAV8QIR6_ENSVE|nr:hypothetical protein OPV22_025948 [Ensete ventricosum]